MIIVKEQHIYDADCASCKDKKNEVNATTSNVGIYEGQIRCAFRGDEFSTDNESCGTMNKLRSIAESLESERFNDDAHIELIPVDVSEDMLSESDSSGWNNGCDPGPSFIVITIYKDRGNVSSAVVCGDYPQHLTLTLKMAEAAIQKYESCNEKIGS